MSKICFGCGSKLQSKNIDDLGYVPEEKLETAEYCQRCFKLSHYGVTTKSDKPKNAKDIINSINKNAKFVVFVVDFINIFDSIMDLYRSIKVPKILAISKSDIIPKNVSFTTIKGYLRKIYHVKEEIVFTSNKSNLNTLEKILYGHDEVYFLGLTNSGKSTLLNKLIDNDGSKSKKLTTSFKENTTQDFVRIKLKNTTLVDSPGFVLSNYELDKLSSITDEIKPITYQNKVSCTYKIGNDIPMSFGNKTNLVFYFSKHLRVVREYDKKVLGFSFEVSENSDIVICGLGFIKSTDRVRITVPQEFMKYINIRPSIVGGKYGEN